MRQRRPVLVHFGQMTTRNLALVMQLSAAIAMTGLYYRIMSDLSLPFVFLMLPVALFVLPIATRFTTLLEDTATKDTVTGVLTGVTCSFPDVVTSIQQVQVFTLSPWTEHFVSFGSSILRTCELLFLPLLLAAILISFTKTIERFPSTVGLATAAATAFSADFTIMTCYVMLRAEDTRGSDVISTLLLLLIPFFLLCLLPLVRDKQRSWLLSLIMVFGLVFWEVIFTGSTLCIWSSTRRTFPVPGSLIGVMFAFHSAFLDWDKLREVESKGHAYRKDHRVVIHPLNDMPWSGYVSNSLLWHCLAYSVERMALGQTFATGDTKETAVFTEYIILGAFVLVMSNYLDASRTYRVLLVAMLMLLQLSVVMINLRFKNTYGLEIILGLTLVCITDPYV